MTTSDYLTQLQQDKADLVDNLAEMGITGLTGDETFTELVPEVLNIEGGGSSEPTEYVVAGHSTHTLTASNWVDGFQTLSITNDVYTIDINNIQIGVPLISQTQNTINIAEAGLTIAYIQSTSSSSSTTYNIVFKATNTPDVDIQIELFNVVAI